MPGPEAGVHRGGQSRRGVPAGRGDDGVAGDRARRSGQPGTGRPVGRGGPDTHHPASHLELELRLGHLAFELEQATGHRAQLGTDGGTDPGGHHRAEGAADHGQGLLGQALEHAAERLAGRRPGEIADALGGFLEEAADELLEFLLGLDPEQIVGQGPLLEFAERSLQLAPEDAAQHAAEVAQEVFALFFHLEKVLVFGLVLELQEGLVLFFHLEKVLVFGLVFQLQEGLVLFFHLEKVLVFELVFQLQEVLFLQLERLVHGVSFLFGKPGWINQG